MDLKTRLEVLPCGKCEDMISCDNCFFVKEAKELYKQIRTDAINEVINKCSKEYQAFSDDTVCKIWLSDLNKLKEQNK